MGTLMQDEDRRLFRWFASKLDSRRLVRQALTNVSNKEGK